VRTNSEKKAALPPEVLAQFAHACRLISDAAADETGFVPVRRLLERFQAKLIARPLLVEGMIASQRVDANSDDRRWLVLVDSEKYAFDNGDLEQESPERSLPPRLRFTVAHELAHSLAFRVSEFGIQLRDFNKASSQRALVSAIESETDRMSSLLLVSQRALAKIFTGRKEPPSALEFAQARRLMGISRPVLVSRLRSLSSIDPDGLKNGYGLRNMAVGVAEWTAEGRAILRSWPVFANFERNVLPEFLINLTHQDRLPAASAFDDTSFSLCGGGHNTVELAVNAGTPNSPKAERLEVRCSVEASSRMLGTRSMYVIAAKNLR
jgi:hypothetical protein